MSRSEGRFPSRCFPGTRAIGQRGVPIRGGNPPPTTRLQPCVCLEAGSKRKHTEPSERHRVLADERVPMPKVGCMLST
ncbi:hypothetical protein trd_A0763 (plasmid) [Thermomicrobium roseum DSM 5159]|uniref:Uncharacterized protein n=1 Tax=Thermomicrobium roseum (strain ATCC 27502 / DSM 5159 / P-2) TaxID=309801 RepID=B9L4P9_THERP|nr:hypothetical protein trd_A0763 [Thermomicrobium roseum DSM 5159]